MRKFSFVALLLGIGLVVYLFRQIGISEIWEYLASIGWWGLVLIPLAIVWIVPNTKGLADAINPQHSAISFKKLMVTRLVGESINYLTPSGYLGGEPMKATLMSSTLGIGNAMGVIVVAKTAQTLALLSFIVLGVLLASLTLEIPAAAKTAAIVAILLLSLGVLAMISAAKGNLSTKLMAWGSKALIKYPWFKKKWLDKAESFVLSMDQSLSQFYRDHRSRFITSTIWHFLGWAMGTIEVLVIVFLLGYSISPLDAFMLSSVATLFMVGGFLIPGGLGAFEMGHYVAAEMVGLPPGVGISICLVRRFREVIWLGIGLVLFGLFYKKFFPKKAVLQNVAPAKVSETN